MKAEGHEQTPRRASLREVATFFLRLGVTAFGGPAAHIAMMEETVVRKRAWMTRERFLDLLGAANLIPGPSSTELAIYIGYDQAGAPGLALAGLCFILPAAAIVLALAWAYVKFGALPQAASVLYGIKPVVIAVIAQALWGLSKTAVKSRVLAAIGALAVGAAFLRFDQLAILLGAGALAMLIRPGAREPRDLMLLGAPGAAAIASAASPNLLSIFLVFAKCGAIIFGSGYVLLAFLRGALVSDLHWLTESQLLDAIAIGQFTPGPVFTSATFIGYLLLGVRGAAAATIGIFAPAFIFVALSGAIIPRLRRSKSAAAFLDGVTVASLALMATVAWDLGRAALIDLPAIAILIIAALLLFWTRINSAWLILGGAALGCLRSLL